MYAILGATGKIGRSTITRLRQSGEPVRAILRDGSAAAQFEALGCEVAVADIHDVDALRQAFDGASAAQIICPVSAPLADAAADMQRSINALGQALETTTIPLVLAISDYGAELSTGTGITVLFHRLEARLRQLPSSKLIFLRSAEHMENWARVVRIVARTGFLPSMHHPMTKLFPTISAADVGVIAADLLMSPPPDMQSPYIVHAEGPRRYSVMDVATALGILLQRDIAAMALPRPDWSAALRQGGLGEGHISLVTELYEAHNAGLIDVQPGGKIRTGPTVLLEALRRLVPA